MQCEQHLKAACEIFFENIIYEKEKNIYLSLYLSVIFYLLYLSITETKLHLPQ